MEEGQLVNLAQRYHSYSCKEQAMKVLQLCTLSLVIVGLGAAAKYFNSGMEKGAAAYAFSAIGSAALGAYAGKKGRDYTNKVEDTRVELRNLELKLLEKRDSLSLPILDAKDISERRDRVTEQHF